MQVLETAGKIIYGSAFQWRCQKQKSVLELLCDHSDKSHILAILGCGKGKSLLYELPFLVTSFPDIKRTIVLVCPFVMLAEQAKHNARELLRRANFNAAAAERLVISWRELSRDQKKAMAANQLPPLLIISPEACSDQVLLKLLSEAMYQDKLAMIVFDEAHTTVTDINYRPVMRDVLHLSRRFSEVRQLYLSGTFTGSVETKFRTWRKRMSIITVRDNVERSDFSLEIFQHQSDAATLTEVCSQVKSYHDAHPDELVLVYAPTKNLVRSSQQSLANLGVQSSFIGVFTGDLETAAKLDLGTRVRSGQVKVLVGTDGVGVGLDLPIKTLWIIHGTHGLNEFAQIAQRAGRCESLGQATVKLHLVRYKKETLADKIMRLKAFREIMLVTCDGKGDEGLKFLWNYLNMVMKKTIEPRPGRESDLFTRRLAREKEYFADVQSKCKKWLQEEERPCAVCYVKRIRNHGYQRGQCMFRRCKRCFSQEHSSSKDCTIKYSDYFSLQGLRQCESCTLTDSLSIEITQDSDYKHSNASTFGSGCDAMYGKLRGGWLLEFCWAVRRFENIWLQKHFRTQNVAQNDVEFAKWLFEIQPISHIPNAVQVLGRFIMERDRKALSPVSAKRPAQHGQSSSSKQENARKKYRGFT